MRRKARGSPSGPSLVALLAVAALIAAVGSSQDGQQLQAQQPQPQQQQQPLQQTSGKAARRVYRGDFLLSAACNTVLRVARRARGDGHNRFSVRVRLPATLCSFGARLGDRRGEEVFLLSLLPLPLSTQPNPTADDTACNNNNYYSLAPSSHTTAAANAAGVCSPPPVTVHPRNHRCAAVAPRSYCFDDNRLTRTAVVFLFIMVLLLLLPITIILLDRGRWGGVGCVRENN